MPESGNMISTSMI